MRKIIKIFLIAFTPFYSAQTDFQIIPEEWTQRFYDIIFPTVSNNGRFVTFKKNYERSSDTLAVVDMKNPDQIIYERAGVRSSSVKFTSNTDLFMISKNQAELLNLINMKVKQWKDIKDAVYVEKLQKIFIHQNNELITLSPQGEIIQKLDDINRIFVKNDRLYYVKKQNNRYYLMEWQEHMPIEIYSSDNKTVDLIYSQDDEYFVLKRDDNNLFGSLIHVQLSSRKILNLTDIYPELIQSAEVQNMGSGKYFIRVIQKTGSSDPMAPDIWNGNDRKLKKKAFGDTDYSYLILNTLNKEITILPKSYSHHFYTGNSNYVLSFDDYQNENYTSQKKPFILDQYSTTSGLYHSIGETSHLLLTDRMGNYLLYPKENYWILHHLRTQKKIKIPIHFPRFAYFVENENKILFEDRNRIVVYDITSDQCKDVVLPAGFRAEINGTLTNISPGNKIFTSSVSNDFPIYIKMYDNEKNRYSVGLYKDKKIKILVEPTTDLISSIYTNSNHQYYAYSRSHLNKPPSLMIHNRKKESLVFQSNKNDTMVASIHSSTLCYQNSLGISLQGLLIYPKDYNPLKKYPVIVSIYEKQRYVNNLYLTDGMIGITEGFNARYFIERGYFVYYPDIVYDDRGTGRSALDCVESSLRPLLEIKAVDSEKIGLLGHSHGGYQTNFIATQSQKFAAYAAGSGNSDLVRSYHSFNYNFNGPFFWQFEDGQYRMPGPFFLYKDIYIDNSPVYHAEGVTKPILLWTGTYDHNIHWEQTMEFYLALKRNQKPVITIFYPKDEHSLRKPSNRIDLYTRISQWFDYHLRGQSYPWIKNGL